MSKIYLRHLVRLILEEEDVLGEPDLSSEDERNPKKDYDKDVEEQNTVASVAPGGMGPNMPIGYTSKSPEGRRKKKKK